MGQVINGLVTIAIEKNGRKCEDFGLIKPNTQSKQCSPQRYKQNRGYTMQDNEQLAAGAASDLNAKLCAFYFNERFL